MRIKTLFRRFQTRMSLRARLCLSFILFTVIVFALLWFFEIVLLERFYYNSKIRETRNIAYAILENYDSPQFGRYLTNTAINNQVCIDIIDQSGRIRYERDVMSGHCMLHGWDNSLYYLLNELRNSEDGTIFWAPYDEELGMHTLVFGIAIPSENGTGGYLLLNTLLAPVGSAISILKDLLRIITILLLVIGCLIAFYLSNRLSGPIVNITHAARRLAHGDFNTKFEGGSYREADELARTLTYAERELSRVDTMQRDLMANVSHDLRTPLTMLKAYAEMIRDISGDNPVKREAHLQVIIEETDRLALLVNDILDLSKLENGSQKLDTETFDIRSRLEDIIARYKGVSEKMGYHIHFTPDASAEVTCDPGKIERVICNLINNAINYTGPDKNVYVRQINTPEGIRIEVQDTGDGIEEDKIQRIFDKYYRSENHKREVVGTGLGLTIVKAILKLHGYHYGVQSKRGEGSVFWFLIRQKTTAPHSEK